MVGRYYDPRVQTRVGICGEYVYGLERMRRQVTAYVSCQGKSAIKVKPVGLAACREKRLWVVVEDRAAAGGFEVRRLT